MKRRVRYCKRLSRGEGSLSVCQSGIMEQALAKRSGTYCSWRSECDLGNVIQEKSFAKRKTFGPKKMLLQIKYSPAHYSRQKSLTNSEFSLTSSQGSPIPSHQGKTTYWSIHRGKLINSLNLLFIYFI